MYGLIGEERGVKGNEAMEMRYDGQKIIWLARKSGDKHDITHPALARPRRSGSHWTTQVQMWTVVSLE